MIARPPCWTSASLLPALVLASVLVMWPLDAHAQNPAFLQQWSPMNDATSVAIANGYSPVLVVERGPGLVLSVAWDGTVNQSYGLLGLSQPEGVTGDPAGNVIVADTGNNRIVYFIEDWQNPPGTAAYGSPGQFNAPCAVLLAGSRLYVVDRGNNRVVALDVTLGNTATFSASVAFDFGSGDLSAPNDIAMDPQGDLWVVDTGNHRIRRFSNAGVLMQTIGGPSPGSSPGQFNTPRGISVDGEGLIYVADQGNDRIQVFRPNGSFVTSWGTTGSGPYAYNQPADVAVAPGAPISARVLVADRGNNVVKVYDDLRFPSPPNSTIPGHITLVGSDGSQLDPSGLFTVTVRDEHNDAMPAVKVTVDLSAAPDLALSAQQESDATYDCSTGRISKITDVNGQASFTIAGHVGDRSLGSPGLHGAIRVHSLAEDFTLGSTIRASALDQDGVNGVDAYDFFLFFEDLQSGLNPPRSDYDGNGNVSVADGQLLVNRIASGASRVSLPRCDAQPAARGVAAGPRTDLALAWNDCPPEVGGSGSQTLAFACNTNTGARTLHATVTPDQDIADVTAFEAVVEVRSAPGTVLPDWWDLHAGGCRSASSFGIVSTSLSCANLTNVSGLIAVETPAAGTNREVLRVVGAGTEPASFFAQQPTDLFEISINNQKTTGAGSCSGCDQPVEITLLSLRLMSGSDCGQPGCEQPDIDLTPHGGNVAGWQTGLFYLIRATPFEVGNQGFTRVRVEGRSIAPGSTVRLLHSSSSLVGTNVTVDGDGRGIEADFDFTGASLGWWDVEVTDPAIEVRSVPQGILVETPSIGVLDPVTAGSSAYRFGAAVELEAGAVHSGNIAWPGLAFGVLTLQAPVSAVDVLYAGQALGSQPVVPNDPTRIGVFSLPAISGDERSSLVRLAFTAPAVSSCGTDTWELFEIPAVSPQDPAHVILGMVAEQASLQGKTFPAGSPGFTTAFEGALQPRLDANVAALTSALPANLTLTSHATLVRTSVDEALGDLMSTAYSADATAWQNVWTTFDWQAFGDDLLTAYQALSSPPAPSDRFPTAPSTRSFCFVASLDPNDKTGPEGVGPTHVIASGQPLEYRVRFQNLPTASAPARDVTVTDALDLSVLNPVTFEFTGVRFGDRVVPVPPGSADFTSDVDLRPDVDLITRTTGTLDPATGIVHVTFRSLDPATLLPTSDPLAGFLPPDVTSPEGEGSVSFRIRHRDGLSDGTTIANQARIVFDANPPIDTPTWENVIDDAPPSSQVTSLSPTQAQSVFQVQWSGADAGAGILDYSVFVSTDGGPYVSWTRNTMATSGDFAGADGHAYAFYSIARDRVGLIEAPPPTPDATTAVTVGVEPGTGPPALAIRPVRPNPSFGNVVVEFALPSQGAGWLALFDVGGRCVQRLSLADMAPGWHHIEIAAGKASPGVYFVRLHHGGKDRARRVVLAR
jgi:hypothetical protein